MNPIRHPDGSIRELLAALRRRQRAVYAIEFAVKGVLAGACLAALVSVVRLFPGGSALLSPISVLLCIPAGAVFGAAFGVLRSIDDLRIARALDMAANGEDRFASAVRLGEHHRRERVQLVSQDALAKVGQVPIQSALPVRVAKDLKLLPWPALALAVLLWLGVGPRSDATIPPPPDITADQWSDLSKEFRKDLGDLPKPESAEDKEFAKEFEKLASMLDQQPRTKEVFEEIAKLREKLENRRQSLPGRSLSMRKAARAVTASSALRPFAEELMKGNYAQAADSLKALAKGLREGSKNLSAEQFEATASDFQGLSKELDSHEELSNACKQCASAASSMNNKRLADSMSELSRKLQKNSESLKQCDKLCRSCNALNQLQQRLNQCKSCRSCKDGKCGTCASCRGNNFVRRNNGKGGSKAGWGTAETWLGGQLSRAEGQHTPTLAETKEQGGRQTTFSVTERDERADSALRHKEVFAEFIQKAEADLSLESVPVAYREFLRRYFDSIQPKDRDGGEEENSDE
jgi:hypothetical protein